METITVDILNPKVSKLPKDLADLDLIAIRKSPKREFSELLKSTRSKSGAAPSPEEIAGEVEAIRAKRYKK